MRFIIIVIIIRTTKTTLICSTTFNIVKILWICITAICITAYDGGGVPPQFKVLVHALVFYYYYNAFIGIGLEVELYEAKHDAAIFVSTIQ